MKSTLFRLSILASIAGVSLLTAYLATWVGLGGQQLLSPANFRSSLREGAVFGLVVSISSICVPARRIKSRPLIFLAAMALVQVVFGISSMLWTAVVAAC